MTAVHADVLCFVEASEARAYRAACQEHMPHQERDLLCFAITCQGPSTASPDSGRRKPTRRGGRRARLGPCVVGGKGTFVRAQAATNAPTYPNIPQHAQPNPWPAMMVIARCGGAVKRSSHMG